MRAKQQGNAVVVTIVIVVVVAILGALSFLLWQNFGPGSKAQDDSQVTQPDEDPEPADITTTLPNGKTAIYPSTEGNRQIIFLSQGESDSDVTVRISHKGFQAFYDSIGVAKVDEICGSDDNLKGLKGDYLVGLLNTSTKQLTPAQNPSCLYVLTSDENPDAELRVDAQKASDRIDDEVNAFISSVTIN